MRVELTRPAGCLFGSAPAFERTAFGALQQLFYVADRESVRAADAVEFFPGHRRSDWHPCPGAR